MSENKNAKTPTDDGQVAHVYLFDKTGRPMVAWDNAKDIKLGDKLYAAPKQWVGLTSDDIHDAFCHAEYESHQDWNDDPEGWCKAFANYVEAKLKEKNT